MSQEKEKKQVVKFLGENERSEEIEAMLNQSFTIGEPEHLQDVPVRKNPEDREYLVLYYATDDEHNDIKSFEFLKGRKATYEFIKGMIESLDIHESKVLVESATMAEIVSVYDFMKHVSDLFDDTFDIEEYNYGDITEEDI